MTAPNPAYVVDSIHNVEHILFDWCADHHLGHPVIKVGLQGLAGEEHTSAVPYLVNIETGVVHLHTHTHTHTYTHTYK